MTSQVYITWRGEVHAPPKEQWPKQTRVIVEEVATLLEMDAGDIWRGPHSWTRDAVSDTVSKDSRHITTLFSRNGEYYKAHIYVNGEEGEAPDNIADDDNDKSFLALWDAVSQTWVAATLVDSPTAEPDLAAYTLSPDELYEGYDSEASLLDDIASNEETSPARIEPDDMGLFEDDGEVEVLAVREPIVFTAVKAEPKPLSAAVDSDAMRKFYQMYCNNLSESILKAIVQGTDLPETSDENFSLTLNKLQPDTEYITVQVLIAPKPRHTALKKDAGQPVAVLRVGPLSDTTDDLKLLSQKLVESWLKGVELQPLKSDQRRLVAPLTVESSQTTNSKKFKTKSSDGGGKDTSRSKSKTAGKTPLPEREAIEQTKPSIQSDGDDGPTLKTDSRSNDPLLEAIRTLCGHTSGLKDVPDDSSKRRAELLAKSVRQLRKSTVNNERRLTGLEGKITLGKQFCGTESYTLDKHVLDTTARPVMEWSIVYTYVEATATKKSSMKVALTIKGLSVTGIMKFTLAPGEKAEKAHEQVKAWSIAAGWDTENKVDEKAVARSLATKLFDEAMANGRV